ncbi:hypothetical protein [Lysobacter gummosus]|uniref:Uncharacterized protein n=1 Tax=Lysobacter gummosus TaxID=262324 RepID=A0ABY3XC93_9GAMM|nr:hypothetical protein [Lysobacter gummosus]ALN94227.1 hypothetical protein LG3211_5295 [Lysobacter gummosus]UNP29635.1 hypothetical protein MOV92_24815 [Lysobacter gummosus]
MSLSRAFVAYAIAIGVLLASPLTVQAHEVVPPDWCVKEKETPIIVAKFDFDGKELREVMAKCGIVEKDDQWHTATETMLAYCAVVAPLKGALPFMTGPDSYQSKEHHSRYKLDEGVSGACAVCPPKPD